MDKQNTKMGYVQKKILVAIYQNGKCEEVIDVAEYDPEKVNVVYQKQKQQIVDERQGQFVLDYTEDEYNLRFKRYKITAYKMKRTELSRLLFHWENLNAYGNPALSTKLLRKPDFYDTKQVTITNALKALERRGFVEFRNSYDMDLRTSGAIIAKIVWLTTTGIKLVEQELNKY